MKSKVMTALFAIALIAGAAALTLLTGLGMASADSPRSGDLHVTKDCTPFATGVGPFCTITSSNLKAIEAGSKVVYLQPATDPLDSDVRLEAGPGNTAFGHCSATPSFVCTFSGGTGKFTHFQASVDVSYLGGFDLAWDGTYSLSPGD